MGYSGSVSYFAMDKSAHQLSIYTRTVIAFRPETKIRNTSDHPAKSLSVSTKMVTFAPAHAKLKEKRSALLKRTPIITTFKFLLAFSFILAVLVFVHVRHIVKLPPHLIWPIITFLCLIQGLMFAHFTELQHELLHSHGFSSNRINRFLGFFCGIFMGSSFSHYRYSHLIHHKFLGTPKNSEFFIYPKRGLNSPLKLALAALDPSRFFRVGRLMAHCLTGGAVKDIYEPRQCAQAATEYALYGIIFISASAYTVVSRDVTLIVAWALPLILVAEPVHFLLELPEHFGLNAYGERDISLSTRTIDGSLLSTWYTNGNNLHTAHHSLASVPMTKIRKLNALIKEQGGIGVYEPTYWSFYSKVMSGELLPVENGRGRIN